MLDDALKAPGTRCNAYFNGGFLIDKQKVVLWLGGALKLPNIKRRRLPRGQASTHDFVNRDLA